MSKEYDVIVIGAGSAGLTSAVGFKKAGKKVLLIERAQMGGDCTNTGCIPSKSLLHHAKTYAAAKTIGGETATLKKYRTGAFAYAREKVAEVLAEETPEHFREMGIDVILGDAQFTGKNTLRVNDESFSFKKAIIASGSRARHLDVPGLTPDNTLTNENLFELAEAPSSLLVVGGGAIGLEMSHAMALLGTKVTMVVRETELCFREDPALQRVLQQRASELNIVVHTSSVIDRIVGSEAVVKQGDAEIRVPFEKVLIAIGRVVNLPAGLDTAGITCTEHGLHTTKNYRTTNRRVFAVGDVANRLKFTHTADDSARQVIARVLSKGLISIKTKPVPKVMYTDPEVAQVGLSEAEAIAEYGSPPIYRIEVPFSKSDRAKTESNTGGVLVVIVKRLSGKVLGAHIAGPRAGDILSVFTLAMSERISMYKLQSLIYAYPTYSLIIKKAADEFFATQLGNLKTDIGIVMKRNAAKGVAALVWITALFAIFSYQQAQDMTVLETSLAIFDFITVTVWGPLLYILVYAFRPLTFFPGSFLTILSGVFFGLWGGILYTIIGANLSAIVAYAAGRFFGSSLRLENTPIGSLVTGFRNEPFMTTLVARLLFLPFDLVNYAGGILKLPFWPYLIATVIGTILGIATFVSVGASLDIRELRSTGLTVEAIDASFLILSASIFVISIGVSRYLKQRGIKKKLSS